MPPINVLIKPASSLCNMKCSYCFYRDEAENRKSASYGMMSEETLKKIIRRTMFQATSSVTYGFQGGEPTLRGLDFYKKAVEFEKTYNKQFIQVNNTLQTNGYLLNEEWCRFLKEHHFLVGLSVDGTEKIHDAHRPDLSGAPTFERIKNAAALMDAYGVEYNILTVVTNQLAKNIKEVYSFYKANNWYYLQFIPCLDPLNSGHENNVYALTPEVYGKFLIDLFDCWYEDLQKNEQPYIRQFENYVIMAANGTAESCDMRGTCGMQYTVEADGSVYPCDFYVLDEYRLGNFNTDRIPQIDEKRNEIGFLTRSERLNESCAVCPYFKLCRGGCFRNRDYDPSNGCYTNYFCEAYKLFFAHSYEKLKAIGDYIMRHPIHPGAL